MSAKFPSRNVAEALERSLKNADLKAVNSAVVAAARVLAERIDYLTFSGFVDENGKLDNVSLPTFLKYCQSLGLTVDAPAKVGRPAKPKVEAKQERPKSDKVVQMEDFMKRFG
ncbi:hypothetical protein [Bifidobacterium adolescentis]|jgi:hypothetical protein|uniref:terminase small subunit n=1 Tax=Bifidobacterium adolescentis TaxID=1680 RepID=UPI0022E2C393|nr:hypothetical protein [Bifidobacterium adolescentis]